MTVTMLLLNTVTSWWKRSSAAQPGVDNPLADLLV